MHWLILFLPILAWANPITVRIESKTDDLPRLYRYREAANLLVEVVNSEAFRSEVINHKIDGRPGFASTANSPKEVLGKIIGGSETLTPGIDHQWSWDVVFYRANNSTVGYTYPNVTTLWVNTKFMDRYDLPAIAGNQAHEMMHKLGFSHDFRSTPRRPFSVPYSIGSIVERLARSKHNQPKNPAPTKAVNYRRPWWRRLF